jgi:hypothetical protein
MGLEPTTFGITIRRSNQLSYIYRVCFGGAKIEKEAGLGKKSSGPYGFGSVEYIGTSCNA